MNAYYEFLGGKAPGAEGGGGGDLENLLDQSLEFNPEAEAQMDQSKMDIDFNDTAPISKPVEQMSLAE